MTEREAQHPIVLAITGASGAVYGVRLLEVLVQNQIPVMLTISESGQTVIRHELGLEIDLSQFELATLLPNVPSDAGHDSVTYCHFRDFMSPIASGSHRTAGMVICPCSGGTMSGIANAASRNLVQRAADVHLKERRKLIVVPRETPLSLIQIRNMELVCQAGGTILPASPGFYHGAEQVSDLVDFVVARILDQLQLEISLVERWGEPESAEKPPGTPAPGNHSAN